MRKELLEFAEYIKSDVFNEFTNEQLVDNFMSIKFKQRQNWAKYDNPIYCMLDKHCDCRKCENMEDCKYDNKMFI